MEETTNTTEVSKSEFIERLGTQQPVNQTYNFGVVEFDDFFITTIDEDDESRYWYARCWNAAIERAAQTAREFDYSRNKDGHAEYVAAEIRRHKSV